MNNKRYVDKLGKFVDWVNENEEYVEDPSSKPEKKKVESPIISSDKDAQDCEKENKDYLFTKMGDRAYKFLSVTFTVAMIVLLLSVVKDLPEYGNPNNPAVNEVSARYVEKGMEETGALNIVAALILDYRAFDTFGEAAMLFTATMAVVSLIRKPNKKEEK